MIPSLISNNTMLVIALAFAILVCLGICALYRGNKLMKQALKEAREYDAMNPLKHKNGRLG